MPTDSMFGSLYMNPQLQGQQTSGYVAPKKSMFQLSPTGDYAQADYTTSMPTQQTSNSVLFGGQPQFELPQTQPSFDMSSIFSNLGDRFSNASIGDLGSMISGVGSIFNAYNQNQYQNKMANLYNQQYAMQKAQQDRINARQDLAQANYDASFFNPQGKRG